jgi:MYXO-CTERM domain-containing protein
VTATVSVSASASDSGVVHNPPVARTTGTTPVTGPAPLTVNFDGSASTGDTTLSYSWDFGDGSAPNTTQKPSHTYNAKGSYTATLTVTDQDAMTGSAFVSISVTGNSPPDVTYASASPASGSTPLVVTFNGSGVTDPEGDNVTLTWNFGDASAVSNAKTVDHTYSTAGSYNASLSAQDDGTPAVAPSTKAFTIIVSAPGQSPDCSAATVTPSSGAAPLAVHMDATGCTDPQGKTPLTFEWHIPVTPEVVLTTATADYTFPSPGTTTIHLIARNNASPPLPTQRDFPITVTGGGTTDGGGASAAPDANSATSQISSGCGCSAATAGPGAVGLLLVALGLVRRRR